MESTCTREQAVTPEPIFEQLVRERGNVPAEVRSSAEREWRSVSQVTGLRPPETTAPSWRRVDASWGVPQQTI